MAEYSNGYDELELDLKDILAEIIKKWKQVCFAALVCGVAALSYAFISVPKAKVVEEERLQEAVNELSVTDAATVERLYAQYESYVDYKDALQNYFSSFLFSDDEIENHIQKVVQYSLSSKLEGAQKVLSQLSLTPEVYEQIRQITPDYDSAADVYSRISISSEERNATTLSNFGESTITTPLEYAVTVTMIANSKDQCSQIQALIDESLRLQLKNIRKVDPDASLIYIGENYNENLRAWINSQQQALISQLQSAESAITNFNNNQIKNLSSEQKTYYDLLIAANTEQPIAPKGPSKKKFALIGVLAGMFLALGWIVLKYILGNDVKTEDEIRACYRIPVLNKIIRSRNGKQTDKVIKVLRGFDNTDISQMTVIAASDIDILLKKNHLSSLYFLCPSDSTEERSLAEELKEYLKKSNPDYRVSIGYPYNDAEELNVLAESGNVVLIPQIKKAKRDMIEKTIEICTRYGLNILGAVTVEEI